MDYYGHWPAIFQPPGISLRPQPSYMPQQTFYNQPYNADYHLHPPLNNNLKNKIDHSQKEEYITFPVSGRKYIWDRDIMFSQIKEIQKDYSGPIRIESCHGIIQKIYVRKSVKSPVKSQKPNTESESIGRKQRVPKQETKISSEDNLNPEGRHNNVKSKNNKINILYNNILQPKCIKNTTMQLNLDIKHNMSQEDLNTNKRKYTGSNPKNYKKARSDTKYLTEKNQTLKENYQNTSNDHINNKPANVELGSTNTELLTKMQDLIHFQHNDNNEASFNVNNEQQNPTPLEPTKIESEDADTPLLKELEDLMNSEYNTTLNPSDEYKISNNKAEQKKMESITNNPTNVSRISGYISKERFENHTEYSNDRSNSNDILNYSTQHAASAYNTNNFSEHLLNKDKNQKDTDELHINSPSNTYTDCMYTSKSLVTKELNPQNYALSSVVPKEILFPNNCYSSLSTVSVDAMIPNINNTLQEKENKNLLIPSNCYTTIPSYTKSNQTSKESVKIDREYNYDKNCNRGSSPIMEYASKSQFLQNLPIYPPIIEPPFLPYHTNFQQHHMQYHPYFGPAFMPPNILHGSLYPNHNGYEMRNADPYNNPVYGVYHQAIGPLVPQLNETDFNNIENQEGS